MAGQSQTLWYDEAVGLSILQVASRSSGRWWILNSELAELMGFTQLLSVNELVKAHGQVDIWSPLANRLRGLSRGYAYVIAST